MHNCKTIIKLEYNVYKTLQNTIYNITQFLKKSFKTHEHIFIVWWTKKDLPKFWDVWFLGM